MHGRHRKGQGRNRRCRDGHAKGSGRGPRYGRGACSANQQGERGNGRSARHCRGARAQGVVPAKSGQSHSDLCPSWVGDLRTPIVSSQPLPELNQPLGGIRRGPAPAPAGLRSPKAHVDHGLCTFCGACQEVCPTGAIHLGDAGVVVDRDLCSGCGTCVQACPVGAIDVS